MYRRNSHHLICDALTDTPVVLVNGARQVGKSTLVAGIATQSGAHVVSLDDATVLAAATADPTGWLASLPGSPAIIDEVQKVPALFSAIKLMVDADRRPGRFLLTGSANVLRLPRISESLAGRMEIITLEPLSQGEIISAGPGKRNDEGKVQALDVKAGDKVLFSKYAGNEIEVEGDELLIMREDDIMGVIEG